MTDKLHQPPHKIAFFIVITSILPICFIAYLMNISSNAQIQTLTGLGVVVFSGVMTFALLFILSGLYSAKLKTGSLTLLTLSGVLCVIIMVTANVYIIPTLPFATLGYSFPISNYHFSGAFGIFLAIVITSAMSSSTQKEQVDDGH